jgi:hypothetical protein
VRQIFDACRSWLGWTGCGSGRKQQPNISYFLLILIIVMVDFLNYIMVIYLSYLKNNNLNLKGVTYS